jgi:aquaporin Z
MKTSQKFLAEMFGTFVLVLGGCGTAVFASGEGFVGILGVALAFGLTIVAAAYGIGHISGAHLNPAVSLGVWVSGRMSGKDLLPYICAQILGAVVGALVIFLIASGKAGFDVEAGFAANGYGEHSPGGYSMLSALITEIVLTFVFVVVILGVTDRSAPSGFAGLVIGLTLLLIHLISIPITNTSVNPARSISQAVFQTNWALDQLWLFILAPIAGAMLAGVAYKIFFAHKQ